MSIMALNTDDSDATPDAEFETLRIDRTDSVARVVLDRPDDLNTITPTLLDELSAAIDDLDADNDVRCLLLTGAGDRAFSAGADLSALAADGMTGPDGVELARHGQQTFGKLEACDTPVVAAIDGFCLGGGMELATAADLRIATDGSMFGQPEHDLGLLPGWGGTQRLPNLIGESRAKEIIFTGGRYAASEMADYGFLARVVEGDEFETVAMEHAEQLAAGPPLAQKYTKRAMRAGRDDTDAGLEIEAHAFGQLLDTEDFSEGVNAFSNDEEPEFTGE
ncbi:enoyl-CoA hydratase/isomerase family protein [Halonotius terrestris]|uniref:Enoyl-CoA hydratase/isomerase family protein n=1 Tax=Halonotius terrestris TaxID=2487750 RepID=A0A8J8TC93_9EURY|nr:enoyl-CoA hydratase/isomerase family protein [Halonotius terrestris]